MVNLGENFHASSDDNASSHRAAQPPLEAFCAAIMERLGYAPRAIVGDGKFHRFSTSKSGRDDAGWYRFHDDDFPAGAFGDWRTDAKFNWYARETSQMSAAERQRLDEVKIEREKKIEAERMEAVAVAKERWTNAAPSGTTHPYLRVKNIGPHGVREAQGRLLVPVYLGGEFVSLQTIDASGEKLFAKGARVEGGSYTIGEPGKTIIIGEGFATCATLHEATGLPAVVAFNAGNLLSVAKRMREKYPAANIIIAADDDFKTEGELGFNPGVRAAKKAAEAVGALVAVPPFDRSNDGDAPSDWNDYAALRGKDAAKEAFQAAQDAQASDSQFKASAGGEQSGPKVCEAPRPLFRPLPPSPAYPVDALGNVLVPAARAIVDKVQCPEALAAQSVLGAASLAVQAHADVEIPATRHSRPLSLFLISVAASGERKSAADSEALWPIRKREKALREAYNADLKDFLKARKAWEAASKKATAGQKDDLNAIKSKLDALGDEPAPPLMPMLICGEPTFEGLCKLLADGQPAMGVFSDEGGAFINGHGMSPDNRLRTVAGLSGVWDGSPIKRVRVLDGSSIIAGKRVSLHLMAQPDAAALLLTDPVLQDQGFLSRLLLAAPASTAGTRFQRDPDPASSAALSRYSARILSILERAPRMEPDTRNELDLRVLTFAPDAAKVWREFADHVEKLLAPGQLFEPIRGFANKLPEHAARIAAVLTLVDNIQATHIDSETFERAVRLAEYYAQEALRLFGVGYASLELRGAEALRKWLLSSWGEPLVSVRAIVRLGPNSIRDTATAKAAIKVLVEHGWLVPHVGQAMVEGQNVREAWKIIREGSE